MPISQANMMSGVSWTGTARGGRGNHQPDESHDQNSPKASHMCGSIGAVDGQQPEHGWKDGNEHVVVGQVRAGQ